MKIVYRFEVTAELPLTTDASHPDFYTQDVATSVTFRAGLERAMLATLRRFEAEVTNLEIVDFSVEEDGDMHDGSCACETCAMERAADTAKEMR